MTNEELAQQMNQLAQEMREGFKSVNERLDNLESGQKRLEEGIVSAQDGIQRLQNGQKYILDLAESTAGDNIALARAVVNIQEFLVKKYGSKWLDHQFPHADPETMKLYKKEIRKRIQEERPELADYIQNELHA